jgi:predicted  nucleic acid-binding Zn-ribbon protein
MTYSTIFDEHDDSIEVKKLRKENNQLKKTIDTLETDIGIKDWHINKLKEEIKELKEALEKTE